jgi:spermidine synthase
MSGAFGLMLLQTVDSIGALTIGLPLTVTAAATLTLVTVPALLMGATVPLLVGHLVRRCGHVGSAAGLLYCVNTLGAGVACLAGIVFLFLFVGIRARSTPPRPSTRP